MIALDTHVHYWDLDRFQYNWIRPGTILHRNWYPTDFHAASESTAVEGHIFVQAGADPEFLIREAEWVSSLREDNDSIRGIVAGWQIGAGRTLVDALLGIAGVVGIRIGLGTEEELPAILTDIELLAGEGLSVDLLGRPSQLPLVHKIATACPDASLIVDHCMKPRIVAGMAGLDEQWRKEIETLAEHPGVICKFSGLGTEVFNQNGDRIDSWGAAELESTFDHIMQVFGPHRVVYGGDWPVSLLAGSYERWHRATKRLVSRLSPGEQLAFWSGTAERVYKLG